MIELKSVSKTFEDNDVLKNISASFLPGQTNMVIGQSGSGKTVLMKCIIGLMTPEKGEINYDGRNLLTMNRQETKMLRREIGMLFQNSALFDSLTVLENVMFPLNMFSSMRYKERAERALSCLDRVNLHDIGHLSPAEISGGMKKRVAIARAITLKPKYLFCDEPNSGLDPKTSIVIDQLIKEITREYDITTIINTHDMNSVMENGDNIVFIHEGRMEWNGSKDEIITSSNKKLNDFIFASDLFKKVKDVEIGLMEDEG